MSDKEIDFDISSITNAISQLEMRLDWITNKLQEQGKILESFSEVAGNLSATFPSFGVG